MKKPREIVYTNETTNLDISLQRERVRNESSEGENLHPRGVGEKA